MSSKNKLYLNIGLSVAGMILILITLVEIWTFTMTEKALFFGGGALLLSIGLTKWVQIHFSEKNPVFAKISAEEKDERLLLIRYKAKHKSTLVTNALIVILAYVCLLQSMPIWLILSLVGIFCANNVLSILFHAKQN